MTPDISSIETLVFDACFDAPTRVSDLTLAFHNRFSAKQVRSAVDSMVKKGELLTGFEPSMDRNRKIPTVAVARHKRRKPIQ